jgi:hypothetical protein
VFDLEFGKSDGLHIDQSQIDDFDVKIYLMLIIEIIDIGVGIVCVNRIIQQYPQPELKAAYFP